MEKKKGFKIQNIDPFPFIFTLLAKCGIFEALCLKSFDQIPLPVVAVVKVCWVNS